MKLLFPLILTALLFSQPLFAKRAIDCADEKQLSNKTINQCYKKSDAILNKVYRSLLKKYKSEFKHAALLRKVQRAWLITRNGHCTLVGREVAVNAKVSIAICEHKMTMHRAKELKVLLNMNHLESRKDAKDDDNQQEMFLISAKSFRGIKVGDKISLHGNYIRKDTLKTGDGDFTVYLIKNFANQSIGYFFPDPNNERLIGDITVTSKAAATKHDIRVGDSFRKLRKKLPALKVFGSELEGRTHARYKNLSYRLDVNNFNDKIKMKDIPSKTKIIEIIIHTF